MNHSEAATAEDSIVCSEEDFRRLAAAMRLQKIKPDGKHILYATEEKSTENDEQLDTHGFSLQHDVSGTTLFTEEDYCLFSNIPDEAITIIGEILTKAKQAHLEVSFSDGGAPVRVFADGTYEFAKLTWSRK